MIPARLSLIAHNIATALLAGIWTRKTMLRRLRTALGGRAYASQRRLVSRIEAAATGSYPPSHPELVQAIETAPALGPAAASLLRSEAPLHMDLRSPRFAPTSVFRDLDVPRLTTPGDIAHWLQLPIEQLDWFTDERRLHRQTAIPDLQHYTYAFRKRACGPPRLIEAPKPSLKTMQRHILEEILDAVPAHTAAHGFVAGRSCRGGAAVHVGAAVVACFDIADFFPTTPLGRVHALFRSLGYPHAAARVLTRLCSTATPESILGRVPDPHRHTRAALQAYCRPHLPQGAPTSPALANLVAYRLDARLAGLAASLGGWYTRYADDLAFSGDSAFARRTAVLTQAVAAIVADEGYRLNERKTRIMRSGHRQQITGIVVNAHPNVPRQSFERLKAILHNCQRNGLDAENRERHPDFRAHLAGRVGWVEHVNPERGRKLRAMLESIP